jgi:Ser/Thr protein kinase RdoA (MazF antagonist)
MTLEEHSILKPYEKLTRLGKLRRLRQIALKALTYYDLQLKWVKFLTTETNTMFQIRTRDNQKFVLRIYSDEESTLDENRAEMFWLHALKRDIDLRVTEAVPRRDGEYITIVSTTGVPGERRCILFKWVPGRTLVNYLTSDNYYKLGQTLAMLHDHAERLKPLPPDIQPKKWDKVFFYPDEPVVYDTAEYSHLFPIERVALLNGVIARADDAFEKLYADPDGLILLHGDLHYWNVHVYQGEFYVIDFEDVMLGYPVQDVAITLSYGRQQEGYKELRAAFKGGYTGLRTWPAESERQIQTLMAARSVNFINYVARIDPSPQEYIEQRCEGLKQHLELYG